VGSYGGTNMSFITFDLSSIPDNSTITSADLTLRTHIFNAAPLDVDVYRVQTGDTVTSATLYRPPIHELKTKKNWVTLWS